MERRPGDHAQVDDTRSTMIVNEKMRYRS